MCTPPITTGILQKEKTMWFIGVELEQETSAPPPKKNPGSAPVLYIVLAKYHISYECLKCKRTPKE